MLENLTQQPPDALLALIKLHDADPRPDKIDLGVGVYRTGQGETPVFGAIKAAEQRLVNEQQSKSYLGPEGDMGFVHALMPYVFGDDPTRGGRIDGNDAILVRPMAYVSLTIDHRVLDGHQTNAWLTRFVDVLETWPQED